MTSNHELFDRAQTHNPGGVNSPARSFAKVGGEPVFIARAEGPYMFDVEGRRYIDYVGSWGPMIGGHAHPRVIEAVQQAVSRGLSFGTPTESEVAMADRVVELVPSMEMVRMVNSGTEATMSAARLARGATGRDRLLKFEGCYHGHGDTFLVKAGSGMLTHGTPTSPGVPSVFADLTMTVPFNDLDAVKQVMDEVGDEVAGIIVEPVAGNMNCIPPAEGFLEGLREVCNRHGSVLIFDEVMTGFRVAAGGAQELYGVTPDLTCLGKIIGGGMPVGAFGGRADLMRQLSPTGPVYQAGTLSGNPVAMAAGLANLDLIAEEGFYERLGQATGKLTAGLERAAKSAGVPVTTNRAGGMFGLFFTDAERVTSFAHAQACDTDAFARFFNAMLEHGVYLAPSAFEAAFVSAAHDDTVIDETLEAAETAFAAAARG